MAVKVAKKTGSPGSYSDPGEPEKLALLQGINARLEVLRDQTRLLYDFRLIAVNRYEFAAQSTHAIGVELGGWIRQPGSRGAAASA